MPSVLTTERFDLWFEGLRDVAAQKRIHARIDRMEDGNFGDYKSVGGQVFEARIHFGPGYRLYFTLQRREVVVLLAGGNKASQRDDIEAAIEEAQLLRKWT